MTQFILRQQSLISQINAQGSIIEFSLPLNQKLNSLDRKSNKLLQKVLAIQQQIQKYAQTEHKQLLPITEMTQNNNITFGYTQSLLSPRKQVAQMYNESQQHQQYVKKMAVLGRNKVKMIQNLQQHIKSLENKFNNPLNSNNNINSNNFNSRNKLPTSNNNLKSSIQANPRINNINSYNSNTINTIQNVTSLNPSKQSLDNQQQQLNSPSLIKLNSKNSLQQEKKQINSKFINYYKHKNDILKQSKSQKFSFRQLKYLTKPNLHPQDNHSIISPKNSIKQLNNQGIHYDQNIKQTAQLQLQKLKQQFTAYQQRTSKQLENYKQRLNQNILQKEILKKELQREKYDHLKDKLFNKTKSIKSSKMFTQRTSRDYNEQLVKIHTFQLPQGISTQRDIKNKQSQQEQQNKQYGITINDNTNSNNNTNINNNDNTNNDNNAINNNKNKNNNKNRQQQYGQQQMKKMLSLGIKMAKTERPTKDQQGQEQGVQDLQVLKDELSMRYVQQNEQILQLRDKLRQSQQLTQQLRMKLEKNHTLYCQQLQQLHMLTQQKQQMIEQQQQSLQQKQQQLEQLKSQIEEMNNFIYGMKQDNERLHQQIEQYKSVIEQFLQQVGTLRGQVAEKNSCIQQSQLQLQQAATINNQCEQQIHNLKRQLQQLQYNKHQLQHLLSTKQSKINYLQTIINKNKLKQQSSTQNNHKPSSQKDSLITQIKIQNQLLKQMKNQHLQQISMLNVQLQQIKQDFQINKQTNQLIISEKLQLIQQLQQNLHLLKSNITQQVDQQVNQAIRTFLRYRKHSSRLQQNTIKSIVYHKKTYITKEEIDTLRMQLKFSQLTINNTVTSNTSNKSIIRSTKHNSTIQKPQDKMLTLRKIIDIKFSSKTDSSLNKQQQFTFKLNIIIKLINFTINYLNLQLNNNTSTLSSKSIKSTTKKLPSLLPENICLVNQQLHNIQDISNNNNNNLQQTLNELQSNTEKYHFAFIPNDNNNNNKQSQSKKDKSLIYLSPQVLLSMNQSQHSYIWTLAILIDQIINHKPYYTKIQEIISRKDNYKFLNLLNYDNPIKNIFQDALTQMLKKNFKQRPTLQTVHQHFINLSQQKQQYQQQQYQQQ